MSGLKLFYSYSHLDAGYRTNLEKWLAVLRNDGLISEWYDGKMIGGDNINQETRRHLREADVVLLLLSQNFLSSKACVTEMKYAFDFTSKKRIVPIILTTCTWKDTECAAVLAFPKDGVPVDRWTSKDDAWLSVYQGVKRVVEHLLQDFDLRKNYEEQLQSIEFVSQRKHKIRLDDIFVFPFLTKQGKDFNGDIVDNDFFENSKNKLITFRGPEMSGKTTLLRKLFVQSIGRNPSVLLDGDYIHKTKDFVGLIRHEFESQITGDFDAWFQLKNKIAFVDNFNHQISSEFIKFLKDNFLQVLLCIDDEEYLVYFKDDVSLADFTVITIKPLSRAKQEDLIRKWMRLTDSTTEAREIDDNEIDRLEEKINGVISSSMIVPRYPFYILSILQTLEAFMPSDQRVTAYGHCYQALVTARLLKKNISPDDLDSCFNYLEYLAYDIYTKSDSADSYLLRDYQDFKQGYRSKFYIKESVLTRLENSEFPIFNALADAVRFEYAYIYYFFLGKYLADKGEKSEVDRLFEDLHSKVNSYAIIFMVHHTQSRELLDTILLHCMCSFDSVGPAKLTTEETRFMTGLIASLPRSIISGRTIEENRKDVRRSQDQSEAAQQDGDSPVELGELYRALKILDILGQILKNRGGSFPKAQVLEMLSQLEDLGLRILSVLLKDLMNPDFKKWLIARLDQEERALAENSKRAMDFEKKLRFVESAIQLFGYIVTVSMISKISYSVNSDKLTEAIRELSDSEDAPSYILVAFLVSMQQNNIDVNWLEEIKRRFERENNHWALRTLSYYVQNHLNTHKVKFEIRQKAYSILDLKYRPNA